MIPRVVELVPAPDPAETCAQLADLPNRVLLDGDAGPAFLCADPWRRITDSSADPLQAVRAALDPYRSAPVPGLPPFQGGAAGFVSYEFGGRLERLPPPPPDDVGLPRVWLGLYDWVIAWNGARSRAWVVSTGMGERGEGSRERYAQERLDALLARLRTPPVRGARDASATVSPGFPLPCPHPVPELGPAITSASSRNGFLQAVTRIREHIAAGDVFQVNLTHRLSAPLVGSAWEFYRRLRRVNPAPCSAFLDGGDWAIASASPERFLRVTPDGQVETRPIKGTRPRGRTWQEDDALAGELCTSEKDRAEHVMIVDLLRNDLSRVCALGTVRVPALCVLESYATVHHLVSTITGRLAAGRDALHLLAAAFPGGSITGAPKIRAMEIIAALEPVARGVYCGAIGYVSATGAMDSSIAIRTCVVRGGTVHFGVGGGVVADSDPEAEYRETLDKAWGMVAALPAV